MRFQLLILLIFFLLFGGCIQYSCLNDQIQGLHYSPSTNEIAFLTYGRICVYPQSDFVLQTIPDQDIRSFKDFLWSDDGTYIFTLQQSDTSENPTSFFVAAWNSTNGEKISGTRITSYPEPYFDSAAIRSLNNSILLSYYYPPEAESMKKTILLSYYDPSDIDTKQNIYLVNPKTGETIEKTNPNDLSSPAFYLTAFSEKRNEIANINTTSKEIDLYSFEENNNSFTNLTKKASIPIDLDDLYLSHVAYPERLEYSSDGTKIAVGGLIPINPGPSTDIRTTYAFVSVYDIQTGRKVFVDKGGLSNDANTAYFSWSSDGKTFAYAFTGERIYQVRKISAEQFKAS